MYNNLEQRKHEALKEYPKPWENESMQDYDGRLGQWVGANESLIRELLQPAPADKEVDEAVKKASHPGHRIRFLMHPDDLPILETLIRAAQQPRQEWIADVEKLEKKTGLTVENALRKLAMQERRADRQGWRNAREDEIMWAMMQHIGEERAVLVLSALLSSGIKLVKQPLPSPPKEIEG